MATFYPVNKPLINYFFYKAPFIQNNYVLTGGVIVNGGSNYFENDIIILNQGSFNAPAIVKVTSTNPPVMLGAVTGVIITSGGDYITTPGAGFDQLATSGIGTGFTFGDPHFAPSNQIPPGPNVPLSGGFIFFYEDENRTVQANTYSDVFDPENPTVNENPLQLGASGEWPVYYMDDRLYYIVITDNTGDQSNPVQVIEHFDPTDAASGQGVTAFNDNFIVNPQFNYPIEFWESTQTEGEITQPTTVVAWGWKFYEDAETNSENFITFEDISGQEIEGSPIFELLLTCSTVSSAETQKDLVQIFGAVDFLSSMQLTFSAQMINQFSSNIPVNLILELNYGTGGSPTQLIILTTFTVTPVLTKYFHSFLMPSIQTFTTGEGNFAAIHIQPALGQTCEFGITNVLLEPGNITLPVFVDEPKSFAKSQILGNSTIIDGAGLAENFSSYYYNNGIIFPYADTGTIVLEKNNAPQPMRHVCDGSSLLVSGYTNNIPNQRLFNVIGTTFGGSGTLVVSSNGNVVTIGSAVGAREHSAYTGGNTTFTTNNTIVGLQMGINLVNNFNNTVTATFINQFAADQTITPYQNNPFQTGPAAVANYWGVQSFISPNIPYTNILITTVQPGSGSQNAIFTIDFTLDTPASYQTRNCFGSNPTQGEIGSWIEFASFGVNTRRPSGQNSNNQQILFQLDNLAVPAPGELPGTGPGYSISASKLVIVPFFTGQSIAQSIATFCRVIANPFQWTVTVVTVPAASQYFLFSDATTDFYGWFTVNGVGTDPAVAGRTGIEIATFTGNTTTQVAAIIAETLNDFEFGLPAPADLPALVSSSKVSWYINL